MVVQERNLLHLYAGLPADFHAIGDVAGLWFDFDLIAGAEVQTFHGKQLVGRTPGRLASNAGVLPAAGNVRASVEDDYTAILRGLFGPFWSTTRMIRPTNCTKGERLPKTLKTAATASRR